MGEKRQIQFERYTNLPLGGNWAGEWPAYVLVHHEGTVDDVRYVPERTCHPTHTREKWECDVCGCVIRPGFMPEFAGVGVLRYCPHCGARIIKEDE